MKKILSILLSVIMIFSMSVNCFAENQIITNSNKKLELTNFNSTTINNRLFISLDELITFLDNDITVKTNNNEIKLYKIEKEASQKNSKKILNNVNGRFEVSMKLNNNIITLNTAYNMNQFGYYNNISSIQTKIDASPTKINGKIYVPLRYILYSLGYIIDTSNNNFECKYIGLQDSTFGIN